MGSLTYLLKTTDTGYCLLGKPWGQWISVGAKVLTLQLDGNPGGLNCLGVLFQHCCTLHHLGDFKTGLPRLHPRPLKSEPPGGSPGGGVFLRLPQEESTCSKFKKHWSRISALSGMGKGAGGILSVPGWLIAASGVDSFSPRVRSCLPALVWVAAWGAAV